MYVMKSSVLVIRQYTLGDSNTLFIVLSYVDIELSLVMPKLKGKRRLETIAIVLSKKHLFGAIVALSI